MSVRRVIRSFILEELAQEEELQNLSDTDPLIESGLLDSLAIAKLIRFLQVEFQIEIGDPELIPENFATVEAICGLVERLSGRARVLAR